MHRSTFRAQNANVGGPHRHRRRRRVDRRPHRRRVDID